MKGKERLLTLATEIEDGLAELEEIMLEARQALTTRRASMEEGDTFALRAMGSILHDFYTAVEDIFQAIATEVNGSLPRREDWHKRLLHSMTLDIPQVRPAVVLPELEVQLDAYRRFRHVFRNVYGYHLEWSRMAGLLAGLEDTYARLVECLRTFQKFLRGVAGA